MSTYVDSSPETDKKCLFQYKTSVHLPGRWLVVVVVDY